MREQDYGCSARLIFILDLLDLLDLNPRNGGNLPFARSKIRSIRSTWSTNLGRTDARPQQSASISATPRLQRYSSTLFGL
jgi:hypothetical protein